MSLAEASKHGSIPGLTPQRFWFWHLEGFLGICISNRLAGNAAVAGLGDPHSENPYCTGGIVST